jgi:DNA-binding NtrC family response regulator/tetratricopeptide (TPR) repeat protein
MTEIIADRFVASGPAWLDLATGSIVRMHIAQAGAVRDQLIWSARCSLQANLRHPLLNPLVDFGIVDRLRTFEAYEPRGPARASGSAAELLLAHAVRFLEAHAVELPRPVADCALRSVTGGHGTRGRPIGVVLQRRSAFEAVMDALVAAEPSGACAITVCGPPGSGLRTLRLLAARAARLQGYAPVAASVIHTHPAFAALLGERHVCVLQDGEDNPLRRAGVGAFLAKLGGESSRRHVLLTFTRGAPARGPALPIEPMGLRAMTTMVFSDSAAGPAPAEIVEAARRAGGRPGLLLAHLGAASFETQVSALAMVRETAPAYLPGRSAGAPSRRRRTAGVLLRAPERASELAARGRHASAERILARALRVLAARGERTGAAQCALALGLLAHDRGRTASAIAAFQQARDLDCTGRIPVQAAIGLGNTWMDDGRLLDAEAVLRTALLAAGALADTDLSERTAAALAECLWYQGRSAEALAIATMGAEQHASSATAAAAVRVHLAMGNMPLAVRSGRQAVALAIDAADACAGVRARRALAEALRAAGDVDAARALIAEGLVLARARHLPIEVLRLKALEMRTVGSGSRAGVTLCARLTASKASGLPRLVQHEIRAACAKASGRGLEPATRDFFQSAGAAGLEQEPADRPGAVAELEALIELCHGTADESAAVQRVCEDLRVRLRAITVAVITNTPEARVLGIAGRPWPGDPQVARRVLAGGLGVRPDRLAEPAQAGEPVRYGGELIAALAARWAAGTAVDPGRASSLLRVGALALAANVRCMLDRTTAQPAEPHADDLVGESAPLRALRDALARAARAPFPVLIEGESGSGKELVARGIHRLSPRRDRRFCTVNCAALTDDLLEAELFGHARGAFTGAVGERAGLFEDADGGTMFLDEVGELSARAQAKLLRVLQDGEVRRVGENVSRQVDVRIVAATNRRLAKEVEAGRFRADLRFRLDVVRLDVPPLRERPGDVPLLAAHFWADAAARVACRATLAPETLAALSRYDWPGNVRELQNVIAWMAVQAPRRGRLGPSGLPAHVAQGAAPTSGTFEAAREEFERRFVRAALATANGQRTSAAAALGVSRQGLAKMLRRLGLERP